MPSLLPLTSHLRRGLAVAAVSLLALTTGCNFITGLPSVERIDVGFQPSGDTIPALSSATAVATVYGKNDKVLGPAQKITASFSSSNPEVATVNSTTGAITAVSKGTTVITATARTTKGSKTLVVKDPNVARVLPVVPTLFLGGRTQLVLNMFDVNGGSLSNRKVTVNSGNTNIVAVESNGNTNGLFLRGVTVGATTISGDVEGQPFSFTVTVQAPVVAKIQGALTKGSNTLMETETSQIAVTLLAPDNTVVSNAGQQISFQSRDQTVATVQPQTGVVNAVRAGTTTIDIFVAGSSAQPGSVTIIVVPIPAKQIAIQPRGNFLRLSSTGAGIPSPHSATVVDSLGRPIPNRTVSWKSTDPSVFTVSVLGTAVAQKFGSASLIASVDNGAVADTIPITVTPVPVTLVTVRPAQSQLLPKQTQQFTATLTDSLGANITGRTVLWQTSNPVTLTIDPNTGLATAQNSGSATVSALVEAVPGIPINAQVQPASVLVLPTPIGSIDVQPATVTVKPGASTLVSIVVKDQSGNQIFGRNGSVFVSSDSPGVAVGDNAGNIRGLTAGTAHITYQGLDQNGNPQGTPVTITVIVQ